MNAQVDVLGVIDRLTGHARTPALSGDPAIRESIRLAAQARAAVADVLDEARRVISAFEAIGRDPAPVPTNALRDRAVHALLDLKAAVNSAAENAS